MKMKLAWLSVALVSTLFAASAQAQPDHKWAAAWLGAIQGPYPVGNPSAQPDLSLAFPSPDQGAQDQTFRLMVRPDIWAGQTRIRLSNELGTGPLRLMVSM